jgi:hypothetical protein
MRKKWARWTELPKGAPPVRAVRPFQNFSAAVMREVNTFSKKGASMRLVSDFWKSIYEGMEKILR